MLYINLSRKKIPGIQRCSPAWRWVLWARKQSLVGIWSWVQNEIRNTSLDKDVETRWTWVDCCHGNNLFTLGNSRKKWKIMMQPNWRDVCVWQYKANQVFLQNNQMVKADWYDSRVQGCWEYKKIRNWKWGRLRWRPSGHSTERGRGWSWEKRTQSHWQDKVSDNWWWRKGTISMYVWGFASSSLYPL